MSDQFKIGIGLSLSILLLGIACTKYKDPEAIDLGDQLKGVYCNDPRAVNYNWGFPGKPDNSICIYPVDSFLGSWFFTDSIYLPDYTLQSVETRTLLFKATEDSVFRHLTIQGWCNNFTIYVTANKYMMAYVDTLVEGSPGQFICTATDTLSGYLNKSTGTDSTMEINFTISNEAGTTFHQGTAVRR